MTSFDLTSPVVLELRAARPRAPEALRERVQAIALRERRSGVFTYRPTLRRAVLVAVPACVVAAVGAALIHGIVTGTGSPQRKASGMTTGASKLVHAPRPPRQGEMASPAQVATPRILIPAPTKIVTGKDFLAPTRSRLQNYRAALTVRVDDIDALSSATQDAMRITRALGGYVVSAHFGAARSGRSSLVVRVPIDHVQQAIARFSDLGKIAAQNIRITDRQAQVDQLGKHIDSLRVRIAKVDDRLADPFLSNEERVQLELKRARLARALHTLSGRKTGIVRRAQLATVSLTLSTHAVAIAKPHHRGPLGRALDDAGTILSKEAAWGLYALIVLGPLAVLALAAFLLVRLGRRAADRRLLESS
jgi:hypothetical protein